MNRKPLTRITTTEQIQAIGWMRWRTLMNSLRATREWVDLLAKGLVGLLLLGMALGPGFGMATAGYFAAAEGKYIWLAVALGVVFLAWQFLPLILLMSSGGFQYKQLLRFPMHFRTFFGLTTAYGLLDPAAIISLVWLVFLLAGIAVGRAALLPWAMVVLAVYAAMNLLLSVTVATWLERLFAKRRTREVLLLVFFLLLMGLQLLGPAGHRFGSTVAPVVEQWWPVLLALPPGTAWKALTGAATGDWSGAFLGLAGLVAYGGLFAWVLGVRLRALFRGEELSEGGGGTREARKPRLQIRSASAGARGVEVRPWWDRGVPGVVAGKDLLYMRRIPMMFLQLMIPVIIVPLFAMMGKKEGEGFAQINEFAFPIVAAYTLLVQSNLLMNAFGLEGKGIQFYLAAPVRFKEILAGKNRMVSLLVAAETLLALTVVIVMFGVPKFSIIVSTFIWLAMALLGSFSLGNVLSLFFPRLVDPTKFKNRQSGIAVLAAMAGQLVFLGIGASVFFVARLLGQLWLAGLIFFGIAAAAWLVYRTVMERVDGIALKQREVLCAELCKNL